LIAQTGGVAGALVEAVRRTAKSGRDKAMQAAGLTPADPEYAPKGYAKRMYEYITGKYVTGSQGSDSIGDSASEHLQRKHDYDISEQITNFRDADGKITFSYVTTETVTESYYEYEGDTLCRVEKSYDVKKEYPVAYEYGNAYAGGSAGDYDPADFVFGEDGSGYKDLGDYHVSEYDSGGYDPSNFYHSDYGMHCLGSGDDDLSYLGMDETRVPTDPVGQSQDAEHDAYGDDTKTSSERLVEELSELRRDGATDSELRDQGYRLAQYRAPAGLPMPDKNDLDLNDPFWRGFHDGVVDHNVFEERQRQIAAGTAPDMQDDPERYHEEEEEEEEAVNAAAGPNPFQEIFLDALAEKEAEPYTRKQALKEWDYLVRDGSPEKIAIVAMGLGTRSLYDADEFATAREREQSDADIKYLAIGIAVMLDGRPDALEYARSMAKAAEDAGKTWAAKLWREVVNSLFRAEGKPTPEEEAMKSVRDLRKGIEWALIPGQMTEDLNEEVGRILFGPLAEKVGLVGAGKPSVNELVEVAAQVPNLAHRIANGHAYMKHVENNNDKRFPSHRHLKVEEDVPISRVEFQRLIQSALSMPDRAKVLENGQIAYEYKDKHTGERIVVIYNPDDPDLGTAYYPDEGEAEFDRLDKPKRSRR
ncbi:MAG: hypothetical protein V2B18_23385, partial [Pseudomonadota bacterium]